MEEIWYVTKLCTIRHPCTDISPFQFTYNPEWFEDEEEEEEEWDIAKWRHEKEEEDLAAEEQRLRDLQLSEGSPLEGSSGD